jgi:hypothetical protein
VRGLVQPYFEKFRSEPSFETLMMCAPSIFIAGVPKEILEPCNALMAQLHKDASRWDEDGTPFLRCELGGFRGRVLR